MGYPGDLGRRRSLRSHTSLCNNKIPKGIRFRTFSSASVRLDLPNLHVSVFGHITVLQRVAVDP